jgi:septal ring factor EnvC (AmiA/AmiB activator)
MRINDILIESQVDEISLAGVGQGIANAARSAAKGYGYVKGIPKALSAASQQGQAAAMAHLGHGQFAAKPAADRTAYNQELAKRLGTTQTQAAAAQDPAEMRKQAQELKKQSDDLKKQSDEMIKNANSADVAIKAQQAQDQRAAQAQKAATTYNAPTATVPATNTTMPTNMAVPKPVASQPAKAATPNFGQGGYGKTTTNVAESYSKFLGIEL